MRSVVSAANRYRLVTLCLFAALGCLGTGCAHSDQELTLTSLSHKQTWRQDFTHAYTRTDSAGNLDVVLTDRAADQALAGHHASAVQQIMHIRVMWVPARDAKAVASNAAITWYVIGDPAMQDVLEYSGTGFVSIQPGDEGQATVSISNALLSPSPNHGALTDPIGPSRLQGSIVAKADNERVTEILGNVRITLAAATSARAAADESHDHHPAER